MIATVIGAGHVGLTTAVCLASKGHKTYCVDRNKKIVRNIKDGITPFYEEGLEELLKDVLHKNMFKTATDLKKVLNTSDIVFICVGTPIKENGTIDLSEVKKASIEVGNVLKHLQRQKWLLIVLKSTVIPGTTQNLVIPTLETRSGKKAGEDFGVCVNPEFLREGQAIRDFLSPKDMGIVIGEINSTSGDILFNLYKDFSCEILRTDLTSAEMIKYARNCYLAKDISFANEIANICQKLGIDYLKVKKGMEMDRRIGSFLNAGVGFGGSCLPKDVRALISKAREIGVQPRIIKATLEANNSQPYVIIHLLKRFMKSLRNKRIAILGLSFKPYTDDVRDAPSFKIIEGLLSQGASLNVYDPVAIENTRALFGNKISYFERAEKALSNSDACIIATEWPEFEDSRIYRNMSGRIILDGRRILDPNSLPSDFKYVAIGYPL